MWKLLLGLTSCAWDPVCVWVSGQYLGKHQKKRAETQAGMHVQIKTILHSRSLIFE